MSRKERTRLMVLNKVKEGELTLATAAEVLQLSYRQAKRIFKRYGAAGDCRPGPSGQGQARFTKHRRADA